MHPHDASVYDSLAPWKQCKNCIKGNHYLKKTVTMANRNAEKIDAAAVIASFIVKPTTYYYADCRTTNCVI